MGKQDDKSRIEELVELLQKYNEAYYQNDAPLVSDAEYDSLFRELEALEKKYPEWKHLDSPTQRVGAEPLEIFEKVSHRQPMLSIANTMDEGELSAFHERVLKQLGINKEVQYFCEVKFDGLSINLTYEDGLLKSAVTRGDGSVGENVTNNVRTIRNVPLRLKTKNPPKIVEIRGEIMLPLEAFQELNKEQEEEGEKIFANPRNAAAGSVRQLDSRITAQRDLKLFAYALGHFEGDKKPKTQEEVLETIFSWGFEKHIYFELCNGVNGVQRFYERIQKERESMAFDIDGVVVKVNRLDWMDELGNISRSPRGMTAYKFPPRQEVTQIEDILIQVGRTGVLSPVAVLKPVNVHGVIVGRAALHNEEEIERKDIRLGDWVLVQRAGDVIPEVVSVILDRRTGDEKKFQFPKKCPSCQNKVVKIEGEVALRCVNEECPAQNLEALEHFVSKRAMDIVGLGPKILEQLVQEKLIKRFSDIYLLTTKKLEGLEGFQEKSIKKLLDSIEKSKNVKYAAFLHALGIRHVGERLAATLAREYPDIELLMQASLEQLIEIRDVGDTVAKSVVEYFAKEKNREEVRKLLSLGVQLKKMASQGSKLAGKTFVITGSLTGMSRQEASEWIESFGGKISSSVSKKTDFLLAGEEAGSKLDKARELNVAVISLDDLRDLLSKK